MPSRVSGYKKWAANLELAVNPELDVLVCRRVGDRKVDPNPMLRLPLKCLVTGPVDVKPKLPIVYLVMQVAGVPVILIHDRMIARDGRLTAKRQTTRQI